MSTVSYLDEPGHDEHYRPAVRCENTYQTEPKKKFPSHKVKQIISDVLESCLAVEEYEPLLCRQMCTTISEVCRCDYRWYGSVNLIAAVNI